MAGLNPAQQAAVEHGDGPLLILAGAGSGKTRVITHRIARLIEQGAAPEAILAVSFTNKAAGEMRERMVSLVGKKCASALHMSTFHSFGLGLIKQEQKALGLDGRFVIFDQSDSVGVVKDVLMEMYRSGAARKLDAMAVLARISNWKNKLLEPEAVPESDFEYDDVAQEVYPEYRDRMRAMRAVDFDDLVAMPVALLRSQRAIREKWQRRYGHLLVDEFQDTSTVQLELVKALANDKKNVCVVGDDDQSIYGWRGAEVGNILNFEHHFPGTRLIKLEQNYRSHSPILEVANHVIAGSDAKRLGKTLRAARGDGDRVRLCARKDPTDEAKFVAQEVKRLRKDGTRLSQVAVLYRSNLSARPIEEELRGADLAYRLYGGTQFFDRKEVKDFAAYLRVVVNPYDEISLRRILNYPTRGVGPRSVEYIEAHAKAREVAFGTALKDVGTIEGIPDNARRALALLMDQLSTARREMKSGGRLHAPAKRLLDQINLQQALLDAADGGGQGAARYQNVLALLGWLERYERESSQTEKSLRGFLERVTLRGDTEKEEESGDKVTLSTLHAAKGLEFPHVFLIGCVEGQIPHSRITDPKASEAAQVDLDEERRLFYVGVTRAQDTLYLTWPKRRMLRGKPVELTPSRYLDGLPEARVEAYEGSAADDMSFDEIAELGRAFLQRRSQS